MADQADVLRGEIQRSNQAVRQWAAGLRDRGHRARAAAREGRARTAGLGRGHTLLQGPDPVDLPSLGEVRTDELLTILVDAYGFPLARAERVLAHGMLICGYPVGHGSVVAADAFEVVERAARGR